MSGAPPDPIEPRVSRRRVLGVLGIGAAGTALGASVGFAAGRAEAETSDRSAGDAGTVPFWGTNQAGITTEVQDRLHVATFDVSTGRRGELVDLLRAWTDAAAALCAGRPVGETASELELPPEDTGEAVGLAPGELTVTIGFGPSLFTRDGEDRFGIARQRPVALIDLPSFAGDELDPTRIGGDLVVQACSNDPQVAFHAVRNLARIGRGVVVPRWAQLGFGKTSATSHAHATPRNLMGFKDGTNNLQGDDPADTERVWVGATDDPAWMRGGTYMVTRRIRMLIEAWDRATLDDQQLTIGRLKDSGAPLGRTDEFDPVPLTDDVAPGEPVIPVDAHVRLAAPSENGNDSLLRRGYSFTDGIDPVTGQLDAGLFFICFQRDPRTQFVPVQRRLASDALNEYIKHVGSGIFAVPPGVAPGGYVGETLFA